MTLQQLRYITTLDDYRSFSKAASACSVTQPTMTMQVKKLEDEMGVEIFDRERHPIEPTTAGRIIISRARDILQQSDALFQYVKGMHTQVEGNFTLAIIPTLAPYILPLFLPEFTTTHPQTHLNIREMQTENILQSLKEGTVDIGLLVTPIEDSAIREVPLFHEPFHIYGPEHLPQKKFRSDELPAEGLLLLDEGHCFRAQTLELCNRADEDQARGFHYRSGSIESLKALVRKGIGYTLVPELSITHDDTSHLRHFIAPEPAREVSLVVHSSFAREAVLEVLRESIISSVPSKMRSEKNYYQVRWRQM